MSMLRGLSEQDIQTQALGVRIGRPWCDLPELQSERGAYKKGTMNLPPGAVLVLQAAI